MANKRRGLFLAFVGSKQQSGSMLLLALLPMLCAAWTLPASPVPNPIEGETCMRTVRRYAALTKLDGPPPRHPPDHLLSEFTMGGLAARSDFFVDDTLKGQGTHYKFDRSSIDNLISQASRALKMHDRPSPRQKPNVQYVLRALHKHNWSGLHVLVYGSMEPWHEALLLSAGARHVTVVEYNKLTYDHPNITTIQPSQLHLEIPDGGYDAVVSFSSFDHDGLGRYGDPIDPNADLRAMGLVSCMLRKGGSFFLTVPVGPDALVWNLHRRYGTARLPLLLQGWDVAWTEGWDVDRLTAKADPRHSYEPVLVLRHALDSGRQGQSQAHDEL